MKETERKPKVSLEDLLQFKRAERPPAEFWSEFEQALRTKQLAAIVETRPWWRSLATSKALVRWCVPFGAAAVVAMTFGSFRGFKAQSVSAAPTNEVVAMTETTDASIKNEPPAKAEQVAVATAAEADLVGSSNLDHTDSYSQVQLAQVADGALTNQAVLESSLEADTVAAGGFVLAQLGDNVSAVSASVVAARAPVIEPLAQVATPRDSRRSRLLAYSVTSDPHAADSSDAARSRERITRRISDQAIYDSITRLGLSGDRVSIKF